MGIESHIRTFIDLLAPLPECRPDLRLGGRWGVAILYLAVSGLIFALIDQALHFLIPFSAACLTTTLFLFRLALMPVPESLGWNVMSDGEPGAGRTVQTPRAAVRAMFPGLQIMMGLHYLSAVFFFMIYQASRTRHEPGVTTFFLFLDSCPIAALLMGAMLAPSLWALTNSRLVRVCAIAGLILVWLVNYWVIFFMVISVIRFFGTFLFLSVLVLSLVLPWILICSAWRAAERKLDEYA